MKEPSLMTPTIPTNYQSYVQIPEHISTTITVGL